MSSIITNDAATAALSTLRSINGRLTDESEKMSSGLQVMNASDNAAYWSISTTMRSDVKAMNVVNDSVGLAQGVVDTAYTGMENVLDNFVEIRNLVITASDMPQPGFEDVVKPTFSLDPEYAKSDVYKIDQRIQQLQDQAKAACQSASKIHPLSASNFDPPGGVDQRLACPALAGVAEGRPSAGG